jgi:DNA repair exonuclease SbcCD ATPase subunit
LTDLHLASLRLVGFRGIRKALDFRFGKRLTILYGGNATGKSSIAQAIEFALTGQVLDHEDNPIPARYLANSMSPESSRVSLRLTDGITDIPLHAAPEESRAQVEQRFRMHGSVDWPDRQRLPVTTTHITSQGTLARVLGADSVTQNDLSGLCAGAYLRFLLTRAGRLADYFRQASTGRNMQTELKDARTALESSRVLRDSLAATRPPGAPAGIEVSQQLQSLAATLDLPDATEIRSIVAEINRRVDDAEGNHLAIQRLLVRMRELGEYEAELGQLRTLINGNVESEAELQSKRGTIEERALAHRATESAALDSQVRGSATIAAYERYQQAASVIHSLHSRLIENQESLVPLQEQIAGLRDTLHVSISKQRVSSDKTVEIEEARRLKTQQREAVRAVASALSELPEETLSQTEARIREYESLLITLQSQEAVAAEELREAAVAQAAAESALKTVSERDAKFFAAISELRTFIEDDACSLCGHRHGSRETLDAAIRAVSDRRLQGSVQQRQDFEQAANMRRDTRAAYDRIQKQLQSVDAALEQSRQLSDQVRTQRDAILARARERLISEGLQLPLAQEALEASDDALVTGIEQLEHELDLARQLDAENRIARNDLERELAGRVAQAEQLTRLAQELQEQINETRASQPELVNPAALSAARAAMASAESTLTELQRESGKTAAELGETDRLLTEKRAQRLGAQRRADVIEGLLSSLDSELQGVGATRDVAVLLRLEGESRLRRDRSLSLKSRAVSVQQQLAEFERYKSSLAAEERFRTARLHFDTLTQRQGRLSRRASEFAELQAELRRVQSSTAETVLKNVREPVGILFRAMTAGCQWDIEFALNESGRVAARLVDAAGARLPANAVLNSAYLNVSAIALRVALASQQNWTTLRTIVLDDPILEMDSLTQSALIDGLEAILASNHSPWRNLQLVITTWSEDFAVMAAHKLAHMNADSAPDREEFLIYRLNPLADGSVVSERHAPRWKTQASAA